jgi:Zn finger protein HypA/HybF involved in hydrogenase expression
MQGGREVTAEPRPCQCADCGKEGTTLRPEGAAVFCPDCLEKKLKPGQHMATCRVCGSVGIEDDGDLYPGICPTCLEDQLAREFGFDLRRPWEISDREAHA